MVDIQNAIKNYVFLLLSITNAEMAKANTSFSTVF